jgi:aspartyl-tRNA(Asn)/glutamyl-tRNA(Gln) amidotransferase subunit A
MSDLVFLSATELLHLYRRGDLSPVEVTRATLDQMAKFNEGINAWVIIDEDGAMAAAEQSEDRWRRDENIGLLEGVPVGIKELFDVRGWPTLFSSPISNPDHRAEVDGPVTARLREAGGVILGKTATPEFSWKGVTDSPLHGVTRNPWNLDMTPGGSSGGASAALAAGMGPLHVGTDAGGSVRIPASFAGVYGLKPTQFRVANVPTGPTATVSQPGPLTRTVEDAALMLTPLAKYDQRDPFSLEDTGKDYRVGIHDGVQGMRIGIFGGDRIIKIDPQVAGAVKAAGEEFQDLGAHVEEADPGFENMVDVFLKFWWVATAYNLRHARADALAKTDRGLVRSAEHGKGVTAVEYQEALAARAKLSQLIEGFYIKNNFDLLLMPTTPIVAFEAGAGIYGPEDPEYRKGWTPLTFPFNLSGHPAASMPCGLTEAGLPIGLQITGPWYSESTILRASRAYESRHPIKNPPNYR